MRKLLVLVLTLAFAMSLAACGTKGQPTTDDPVTTDPAGTEDPASTDLGDYPNHNISWVVPVAAGSATDLVTRAVAERLDLGTTISIENITGGAQTIGANEVMSRDADGYTLLSFANAGLISQPILNPDIGYGLEDFRLLAMLAPDCKATVTVSKDSDIKTARDWIDFVTSGEPFTYAVPGSGGYGHISMLNVLGQLNSTTGTGVAYEGNNGAYTALLTNEVDFCIVDDNFIFNYYNQGECNVLGCVSMSPSSYLDGVPALSDYGLTDLDALGGWKVLTIRSETPDAIVEYIKEEVNKVLGSENYKTYLETSGYGAFDSLLTEDELTDLVKKAYDIYSESLKNAGLM